MRERAIHPEVVAVSGVCHGEMQTPGCKVLTLKKEAVLCVNVCQFSLCTQFELEIYLHCLGKPQGHWLFTSGVVSFGGRGRIWL